MTDHPSLADQAVEALAAIKALDERCQNEYPERHAMREVRRAAVSALSDAFRRVTELARVAECVRDFADSVKEKA